MGGEHASSPQDRWPQQLLTAQDCQISLIPLGSLLCVLRVRDILTGYPTEVDLTAITLITAPRLLQTDLTSIWYLSYRCVSATVDLVSFDLLVVVFYIALQ